MNLPPAMNFNRGPASNSGYRSSLEPFLLVDFMQPNGNCRVLDIGTGNGIIPNLLLRRQATLDVEAVEIQPSLFQQARGNLNSLSRQVLLFQDDFLKWAKNQSHRQYDWIVSNPPYRKLNTGRINPNPEKAVARHELCLSLHTLIAAAAPLLQPEGRLVLSYPESRLEEVLQGLQEHLLVPQRLRHIRGNPNDPPLFFLIQAVKATRRTWNSCREDELVLHDETGGFSTSMQEIYQSLGFGQDSKEACRTRPLPRENVA